jgi:hypothetical protein
MNRRDFLLRMGVGAAVVATGAVVAAGLVTTAPVGAVNGDLGPELVVNGSFEDGLPGAELPGWTVLV